jgi:predicted O-methyltransferase YrrM
MTTEINQALPPAYALIDAATKQANFGMASDIHTCSFLKTLAATKPGGKFLELGTGSGLSTSWILAGMDANASLISVDNDPIVLGIAREFLGGDSRLTLQQSDGGEWIAANRHLKFDYIFADTWHGKYLMLEDALNMLNPGGLYIIDDMLPQPNWPEGHDQKALNLVAELEQREELVLTKLHWATGIVVCVKNSQ